MRCADFLLPFRPIFIMLALFVVAPVFQMNKPLLSYTTIHIIAEKKNSKQVVAAPAIRDGDGPEGAVLEFATLAHVVGHSTDSTTDACEPLSNPPRLEFVHIPKTGGSSIEKIASEQKNYLGCLSLSSPARKRLGLVSLSEAPGETAKGSRATTHCRQHLARSSGHAIWNGCFLSMECHQHYTFCHCAESLRPRPQ